MMGGLDLELVPNFISTQNLPSVFLLIMHDDGLCCTWARVLPSGPLVKLLVELGKDCFSCFLKVKNK